MAKTFDDPSLCYLCGLPIGKTTPTLDHTPPKRLFPSRLRKTLKVNLLTLKAHPHCHKPWKYDEEYFFNTFLPHALDAPLGAQLAEDFKKSLKVPQNLRLALTVKKQFDQNPSGLILLGDAVIQKFDGARLTRVIWKIVRGLFFADSGKTVALPVATPFSLEIYGPLDPPAPAYVIALMGEPSCGLVPQVLDYKVLKAEDSAAQFWNLLLWERYVIFVAFHEPGICKCGACQTLPPAQCQESATPQVD